MSNVDYPYPVSLMGHVKKLFTLIEEARQGAYERQDPEFGDDAQVLGIRAYKNFVAAVERVKSKPDWEWLRAEAPKGRLTLQIDDEEHGSILLRVWRADDPEQDAEEKRMLLAKGIDAHLELFPTEKGDIDRWGLVYQTDPDLLADTAYLIGYSSKSRRALMHYEVPSERISGAVVDLSAFPQAVEIPPTRPMLKDRRVEDIEDQGK